ncbi:MAG TPA: hypothetical protein DCS07_03560 [Bdellovibrionales bacterium]|nr:MAG: hypothetical protein A2Z97_10435 [Bdellovibrionales bacterium GWB1_52_6]OFZ06003.1 MAG: hypothetical protein A2X97_01555 [Bdellovibrionales bacterium GWA1_52_35]OFZ33057.1 MAG: hypothetical protein A2070_08145 [Bdellovibrionales bacterium GWC1_52_8]HAR41695.1 hypothetical protein [Bdellovibrionales bacterium]HCM39374.1 hypothetical protein [Bdellovibrionales bacterium]
MASSETWRVIQKKNFRILQPLTGFSATDSSFTDGLSLLLMEPQNCILNCAGMPPLDEASIERLRFLEQQLQSSNKKLRLVFASEPLRRALANSTAGSHFVHRDSLLEAIEELYTEKADSSKRQFIKAFVSATLRTFLVQSKTEAKRGAIGVKHENTDKLLGDISGVIQVNGTQFSYAIMLSFPKATFLGLVKRLLDEDHTEIHAENQDAAAEFMNIIFGQAKLVLNLQGAGLKPQLPKIALSTEFQGFEFRPGELTPLNSGKTVVIPFESPLGNFYIEVWFPEEHAAELF